MLEWRGPLLWHPSSASVLRSSSETTSALCCLPHWTHYNCIPQKPFHRQRYCLHPAHCSLPPGNKNTYVRMLFVDYSSAFTHHSACHTGWEAPGLWDWTDLCAAGSWTSWQAEVSGQNGQQHLISPDPQHWCPAGLRPQPTPVLPVTHDCTATHSSNVIVKFADDTTVIGLITDNDETAYREEVEYPD